MFLCRFFEGQDNCLGEGEFRVLASAEVYRSAR